MTLLNLNDQEFHTIIAALKFYQAAGQGDPEKRSNWTHYLATDNDRVVSLDDCGISELVEKIILQPDELLSVHAVYIKHKTGVIHLWAAVAREEAEAIVIEHVRKYWNREFAESCPENLMMEDVHFYFDHVTGETFSIQEVTLKE